MTTREQIRHLLRRFGFQPSLGELALYEPQGVDATIAQLIDYDKVDEGFPISPWEICFEPGKTDVYVDPPRIGMWWALRMLMTKRPLQENLTFFWHNHFAVGAQKVEFGPMMCAYLQAIRENANGHFPTLLQDVSVTPAMLRWLDTDTSVKGRPNENFARELMELFTIGIGHYAETDVKEAARAFTGWGLRYLIYESGGENVQARLRESVKNNLPMVAFCDSPELHDTGLKTVLGQSGAFNGYDVLRLAASRPETARRITKKLWEWYAYADPEPKIVDKLAATFQSHDYQIKPVLHEIATMPEFWSDTCVRQKVKSPAEFIVGILRQVEPNSFLSTIRPANSKDDTPLPPMLRGVGGLVWGSMYQQGLALLYPPDVSGWHWGKAWLTSANMYERMKFSPTIFGVNQADKGLANYIGNRIKTAYKPSKPEHVVDGLLEMFDTGFSPTKHAVLVKACAEAGGHQALDTPDGCSKVGNAVCRLVFSSPEFQMC
ncbi:MAG: DUF1800 family protein [Fimbriimonadales bacterium]